MPLVRRITGLLDWVGRFDAAAQIVTIVTGLALATVGIMFGTFQAWLYSLPWPISTAIVLGVVIAALGSVLLLASVVRQRWLLYREFPVYLIASADDDGIDVRVHNKRSKDEFKIQLTRCGGSVPRSLLPRPLQWKGYSGEYRMIPQTMDEVARLCDYRLHPTKPLVTVTISTADDSPDISWSDDFGDFFGRGLSTDLLFNVVVVGHATPAKWFTIIARMRIKEHGCVVTTEVSPLPERLSKPLGGITSMTTLQTML